MITGIGTDLIEVDRVLKACEKETFLRRYYSDKEIDLIRMDRRKSADNFAVKEAVSKMLGTGFRDIQPIEIEVLRNKLGKPYVNLYGKAAGVAAKQGITIVHVSISNTRDYASAFVVGEQKEY